MDVETYVKANPLPARPSDKRVRAYLQGFIEGTRLGGVRFTQGAAQALATLAADHIMQRPSIPSRRGELVRALAHLDAVAARIEAADASELTTPALHARAAGRIDAHSVKVAARRGTLAGVPGVGASAAAAVTPRAVADAAVAAAELRPPEPAGSTDTAAAGDDDEAVPAATADDATR